MLGFDTPVDIEPLLESEARRARHLWRKVVIVGGAVMTIVGFMALMPLSSLLSHPPSDAGVGALPPGYDERAWCPSGLCLRRVVNDDPFLGPKSRYFKCFNGSSGALSEAVWTGDRSPVVPPSTWTVATDCQDGKWAVAARAAGGAKERGRDGHHYDEDTGQADAVWDPSPALASQVGEKALGQEAIESLSLAATPISAPKLTDQALGDSPSKGDAKPDAESDVGKQMGDWKVDLVDKLSKIFPSATAEQQKQLQGVQDNLEKAWDAEQKSKSLKGIKDGLDQLTKGVTVGAEGLVDGIRAKDSAKITEGVMNTVGSVFSAIGSLAIDGGPELAIVGAVLSFVGGAIDFFVKLANNEAHGTTSITDIISRVVGYQLKKNNVHELQNDYESVYNTIHSVHAQMDSLAETPPTTTDAAGRLAEHLLDESDLKQTSINLDSFIGKVQSELASRLGDNDPTQLSELFEMYWQSLVHFCLLEQRAVGLLSQWWGATLPPPSSPSSAPHQDVTGEGVDMMALSKLRLAKLMEQRRGAADFFRSYAPALEDMTRMLLIGNDDAGQPYTHLNLQLVLPHADPDDLGNILNLSLGRTLEGGGYPYAVLRDESELGPSDLEVYFNDDSLVKQRHTVTENDYVSFVNPNDSDAEYQEEVVLYTGHGYTAGYESKDQAGYNRGGEAQKEDEALFRFERVDSSGNAKPLQSGAVVKIWEKAWSGWLLCGGKDGETDPEYGGEDSFGNDYWYIREGWDGSGYCELKHWVIHVQGNENLKQLAGTWKNLVASMV